MLYVPYSEYVNISKLSADFVHWNDAPEEVRAEVRNNPDAILIGNVRAKFVNGAMTKFRYGPGVDDYPHVSPARWAEYLADRRSGKTTIDHHLAAIRRRSGSRTVVSASRHYSCGTFPLEPTVYLATLVDTAMKNMKRATESRLGSTWKDEYVAMHWRRGDKCDPRMTRGDNQADRCGLGRVGQRKILSYCREMAARGVPVYIASDETDPAMLERWKSLGCLVWTDLGLDVGSSDSIFVDFMLMTRSTRMWTLGSSSIDELMDLERKRTGKHEVRDVSMAFRRNSLLTEFKDMGLEDLASEVAADDELDKIDDDDDLNPTLPLKKDADTTRGLEIH